jgi:hypothetical protein
VLRTIVCSYCLFFVLSDGLYFYFNAQFYILLSGCTFFKSRYLVDNALDACTQRGGGLASAAASTTFHAAHYFSIPHYLCCGLPAAITPNRSLAAVACTNLFNNSIQMPTRVVHFDNRIQYRL